MPVRPPVRSATRMIAERARGLARTSVSPGLMRASARSRRRRFGAANGARRSTSLLALARDEGLDDAVFERMEADHDQPAARRQQVERRVQALFELLKLGIDENPKSLKCARCRVLARLAGLDRTSHDVGQLAGGSNGFAAFAASNKRLCNRYSKPFFPIVTYHLRNVALVGAGKKVGRALAAGGVHAHVQRAVEAEAEAALGVVDLRRRDAEVEQQRRRPASMPSSASVCAHAARSSCGGSKSAGRRPASCPTSPPRRRPDRGRSRSPAPPAPSRDSSARECPPRPKVPST